MHQDREGLKKLKQPVCGASDRGITGLYLVLMTVKK